jgi:hypothetical protein
MLALLFILSAIFFVILCFTAPCGGKKTVYLLRVTTNADSFVLKVCFQGQSKNKTVEKNYNTTTCF